MPATNYRVEAKRVTNTPPFGHVDNTIILVYSIGNREFLAVAVGACQGPEIIHRCFGTAYLATAAVSYTHLTLPTIYSV